MAKNSFVAEVTFKDYHFSFVTLSEILSAFNQLTRCFMSTVTS